MPRSDASPTSSNEHARRLAKLQELRRLQAELAAVHAAHIVAPASPAAFAVAATAELQPGAQWKPYRWLQVLDDYLVELARDEAESFLIVEAPVRHGKSLLTSVWFPAWWHGMFPDDPVIGTSHNQQLADTFSGQVRDLLRLHGHRFAPDIGVSPTTAARDRWDLTPPHRGRHVAVGVGNPPTGRGGKLIVIDDPIRSDEEAYSSVYRDKLWRWWQMSLRTRLEPRGSIVVVMSRWSEDDLVGRLLRAQEVGEEEGTGDEALRWRVLHLPALAEPSDDEPDPLGRAAGEALCPERFTAARLHALRDPKTGVGPLTFEALYQGRPTTPEGGMFRVESWHYVKALPHDVLLEAKTGTTWLRRWDLASTELRGGNDPDWTAGVLMARTRDGRTYVVDARRIRAEPLGVQRFIRKTFEEDRDRWGCRTVRIARGMDSKWAHSEFSRLVLPDADFGAGTPERGPKDLRARPFAAQVEAGNVWLLGEEGTGWRVEYVEEFRGFPVGGRHDDWVDASALAYLDLADSGPAQRSPLATARTRHRR